MALKTVLITGCSTGGIGHGLAIEFARRGLHVFATARSPAKMSDLEKTSNITLLTLDVTSPTSIAEAVTAVKTHTGGTLDYLVNNSGSVYAMPLLDADISAAKSMFDVNLWGVVAVTQAFAPLLMASQGMIVNISSVAAVMRAPWLSLYSASKAAGDLMGEILRTEMQPFGVKVMTVVTGVVRTKIFNNAPDAPLPEGSVYEPAREEILRRIKGEDTPTAMTTEDYAKRVVGDVLAGKTGHTYRGKFASVGKVLVTWLPEFIVNAMVNRDTGLEKLREGAVAAQNK